MHCITHSCSRWYTRNRIYMTTMTPMILNCHNGLLIWHPENDIIMMKQTTIAFRVNRPPKLCRIATETVLLTDVPIPATARSKAWTCCRLLVGIAGSNPAEGMDVCLLWVFVLSGRGLCDGLSTCPEESYRVWCVWVWSWSLNTEEALVH
jgi:hypothetical protein